MTKSPLLYLDFQATPLSPGKLARKRQLLRWLEVGVNPRQGFVFPRASRRPKPCTRAPPLERPQPCTLADTAPRPESAAAAAAAQICGGAVNSSRSWMNNEWSQEGKPGTRGGGKAVFLPARRLPSPSLSTGEAT